MILDQCKKYFKCLTNGLYWCGISDADKAAVWGDLHNKGYLKYYDLASNIYKYGKLSYFISRNGVPIKKFYDSLQIFTSFPSFSTWSQNSVGLILGSGDTPVSPSDVKLANRISSGLANTSGRINESSVGYIVDQENNIFKAIKTYALTNQTTEDIVIREYGMFVGMEYGSATPGVTSNSGGMMLLSRDLLEEPVTVPAEGGAALTIQYICDFSWVMEELEEES